jgi:hypothetical protein
LGRWGLQGSSVEQTTRFDERSCSSSRESVSSAVDSPCTSVTTSLTVSGVSAAIWILDDALVVVFRVVAVVFVAVVGGDVAVAMGGSGCETRGCGGCRGAVGRLGSECRRSRGAGSCFEAGDEVVVAVVDSVGNVDGSVDVTDGGCAGVVNGAMAMLG